MDLSAKRWTVDCPEDLELISRIYKALHPGQPLFGMQAILDFLNDNPGLEKLNSRYVRNEGYAKSLAQDRIVRKENDEA